MKNVVNFSGGRTSAYMVYLFEEKKKRDGISVEYIFCDTGAEHPKTYEFIKNVAKYFNIEITCLRPIIDLKKGIGIKHKVVNLNDCGQDLKPFKEKCEKYSTPAYMMPHCSSQLKTDITNKYCR